MISLLLATGNKDKVRELSELLSPLFKCSAADDGRAPKVIEDGNTYRENLLKKAKAYYQIYRRPVLADDSGIEIDALKGGPGVHSADFGGSDLQWPERWKLVYRCLTPHPKSTWTARFRCLLCYFDGEEEVIFEAVTEGRIADAPQGTQGFGYDPIFHSTDLGKTFGIASDEEKARVSHRGRAAHQFLAWAQKNLT